MEYMKGKGAQINVANQFAKHHVSVDDHDGIDEELLASKPKTELYYETPKKIISYNASPDLHLEASVNPYQGCEHGCVYCYARNSHEYWGFSAGLDFETKIVVKRDAAFLLEKAFLSSAYKPKTLMLSGNTDCYQPLEKKFGITRALLSVCLKYRHPVSIVTKNALVTRDLDILKELAKMRLVKVIFSITTQDEELRRILEPRTASARKKFEAMEVLNTEGVPAGIMTAPIIPALNHHEIPSLLKTASENGATFGAYTVVRLNGQIAKIFKDWLEKNFPDRASKVWNQVAELHGGSVKDTQFGRRMSGEGKIALIIRQLFESSKKRYMGEKAVEPLDTSRFLRGGNYSLF